MIRRKQKNKFRQYFRVLKRKVKRLNPKKVRRWFKINLKQHPFVLGILFFIWIDKVLIKGMFRKVNFIKILKVHLFIFILWLALVIISNILRDKQKVKWYLKRRFVFFMLLFFQPLGLILLWSGAKFRKITKIIFTIIFGLIFIIYNVQYNKKYEQILKKSSFERIVEKITQPKKGIFLEPANNETLRYLKLTRISKKRRVKLAISEISVRCSPAIVSIKTKGKDGKEIGMGTGFIISEDGVIITNFHVMESAYQAEVKIGEEVFKEVYLIKGVPSLDIAIVKINAKNLPVLSIGDSDTLLNGQFIIVLGNPGGFERSVSHGIISAIRSKGNIKIIQMTAPVSIGSSGGPLINEYGEVVGITTLASFFIVQNLNFAIPINYLDKIINEK